MAETADAKDDVHRLRDILVEEVSLVDRAANKRRFLVVKRSDAMQDGEDQELDEAPDATTQPDARNDDVSKAKKKPRTQSGSQADDEDKSPSDEELGKARPRAAKAPEDDGEEVEAEKAKPSAGEDGDKKKARRAKALSLPTPMKDALLAGLTDALERLMAIANAVKEAATAEGDAEVSLPDKMTAEMDSISELISGLCEAEPEAKRKAAAVEKAGARMSRDRLDRFQKALSLLADILKELTNIKLQTVEPTAGAAQKAIKKQDPPAAQTPVPGMVELVAGISDLTKVVKRQEEELGRIRQTRGVSNAIQVDGGGHRAEPADVSWPLDMNRPINREQVKKEVSFFDE